MTKIIFKLVFRSPSESNLCNFVLAHEYSGRTIDSPTLLLLFFDCKHTPVDGEHTCFHENEGVCLWILMLSYSRSWTHICVHIHRLQLSDPQPTSSSVVCPCFAFWSTTLCWVTCRDHCYRSCSKNVEHVSREPQLVESLLTNFISLRSRHCKTSLCEGNDFLSQRSSPFVATCLPTHEVEVLANIEGKWWLSSFHPAV